MIKTRGIFRTQFVFDSYRLCYQMTSSLLSVVTNLIFSCASFRASKIRNLSAAFSVHLITCLCTRSCTSYFLHLKQLFVHACTLTCTSQCTYYKDRNILEQNVNLRSIPLTINPEPSMSIQTFFIEKETTDGSLIYREPNNQLKATSMVNEHGRSFPVLVDLRQRPDYRTF